MASIHFLKKTDTEAVIKCYTTDSSGATIDIALSTLAVNGQIFNANTANVAIQEMHWGAKANKQIDVTRSGIGGNTANVHGHYYFTNAGTHNFVGFVDNAYANSDIRIIGDGPFHVIIKLRKTSGY